MPASINIVRGNNQIGVTGKAVADSIVFRVLTVENAPASGAQVSFTVTGGGTLASSSGVTNGAGEVVVPQWTLGPDEGPQTITATVSTFTATANLTAVISFYNIEIQFIADPTVSQRAAFDAARLRWRQIIQGEMQDAQLTVNPGDCSTAPAFSGAVDDVLIFVDLVAIDGPGNVLGSAGPCFIRFPGNQLTVAGIMRFDTADLDQLQASGQLNNVILHEMGHVLGIGSLWSRKGVLDTVSVSGDPIFTGTNAVSAFSTAGGATCNCRAVPVENSFGPGTRLSHWREEVLRRELMTGFLNAGGTGLNPLSAITISSLRDMGYTVDMTQAESFSLAAALRAQESSSQSSPESVIELIELELKGPIRAIDERGRVTALYPRSSRKQ